MIVDEAHNLLDTISQIHSAEITNDFLNYAVQQVNQYYTRYSSRLLPKNLLYMKQVKFILSKLKKLLDSTNKSRLLCTYDFINETEISNLDLLKLVKYIETSKLAQKVGFLAEYLNSDKGKENENKRQNEVNQRGVTAFLKRMKNSTSDKCKTDLSEHTSDSTCSQDKEKAEKGPTSSTAPIINVTSLLKALISVQNEGRILISISSDSDLESEQSKSIKYMLLNPSSQFTELISECRSIIVAGGTMHPLSEFRDQLFIQAGAEPNRIMHFSCDHVVPGENILPLSKYILDYGINHLGHLNH